MNALMQTATLHLDTTPLNINFLEIPFFLVPITPIPSLLNTAMLRNKSGTSRERLVNFVFKPITQPTSQKFTRTGIINPRNIFNALTESELQNT